MYLTEPLFCEFRNFLRPRVRRNLTDGHRYHLGLDIKRRVEAVGLGDAASYLRFITRDRADSKREVEALIDQVTAQTTEFFRHPDQIAIFRRLVGDVLRTSSRSLRLWSAGCATGEEAYTMAMVVQELGCTIAKRDLSLLATDVGQAAIDRARRGVYRAEAINAVPERYRSRYFQTDHVDSDSVSVTPDIRRMVTFGVLNLTEKTQYKHVGKMDVIFCRNVLLYFDLATKKSVVNWLWRCLRAGGYLVLGPCDGIKGLGEIIRRTPRSGSVLRQLNAESWLFPTQGG